MMIYLSESENIECVKSKLQLYKSIQVIVTYLTKVNHIILKTVSLEQLSRLYRLVFFTAQ